MSANVSITRRATFAAAHILCRDDWSDEKNREVFGACTTDHGHNYVIEVTVGGTLDPDTGMVVNLKHVDAVLRRECVDAVDPRRPPSAPGDGRRTRRPDARSPATGSACRAPPGPCAARRRPGAGSGRRRWAASRPRRARA